MAAWSCAMAAGTLGCRLLRAACSCAAALSSPRALAVTSSSKARRRGLCVLTVDH